MSVSRTDYEPIEALVAKPTCAGYLSQFCALTPTDKYYVRNMLTGTWRLASQKAAINLLTEQHAGWQSLQGKSLKIDRARIEGYVKHGAIVVDGATFIPNGPAAAIVAGRRLINVYNPADLLPPMPDNLLDSETREHLHLFMRIIRESLCAKVGEKSLDDMLGIIASDDPFELEFRMVMHWLAAIQQSPGINLQTNLWFLGELGGIGKGTLERVLKLIYGPTCGSANQTEVEAGWTDHFANHVIMVVDEFRDSRHFAWSPFIKRETTNSMVTLRRRHEGTVTVLNTMNWLFFSNNECPMRFDDHDRRNFLVATTHDTAWTERVTRFNHWLDEHPEGAWNLAAGFADMLAHIQVDRTLISRAQDTGLRQENRQFGKNAVQVWLEYDDNYPRDSWLLTRDMYRHYAAWKTDNAEDTAIRNVNSFSRHLGQAHRRMPTAVQSRESHANLRQWCISATHYPPSIGQGSADSATTFQQKMDRLRAGAAQMLCGGDSAAGS